MDKAEVAARVLEAAKKGLKYPNVKVPDWGWGRIDGMVGEYSTSAVRRHPTHHPIIVKMIR